jgi:lysophospholipase L1-like esterase
MKSLPRIILGTLSMACLAAGGFMLSHRSGFGCGPLILGRYSLPVLIVLAGLLVAGGVGMVATLALSRERVAAIVSRLVLLGFGVVLALVAVEGVVRITQAEERPTVEKLRITSHEVIGSWRPANATLEWDGQTFETDGNGVIVRTPEGNAPPPGARRVMMVGDSYLEGVQVAPDENMSVLLGRYLGERGRETYHVLNLGMSGFGPLRYLLVYRTFAPAYRPDIVIAALYVENDFADDARLYHQGRIVTDEEGEIVGLRPEVDLERMEVWHARKGTLHLESEKRLHLWPPRLLDFARQKIVTPICVLLNARSQSAGVATVPEYLQHTDSAIYGPLAPEDVENVERTLGYLEALHREATDAGAEVYFVIIPEMHQVDGGVIAYQPSTQPQEILLTFCAEEGIRCLDLLPIFEEHKDETLYFPAEGHFTQRGHELAAQAIAAFIMKDEN